MGRSQPVCYGDTKKDGEYYHTIQSLRVFIYQESYSQWTFLSTLFFLFCET